MMRPGKTGSGSTNNNNNNNNNSSSSRPGAYAVSRTSTGPAQVFRVTVPAGVRPNQEFSVHAGTRRVRVRCPPASRPGQIVQITLPPEPITSSTLLRIAPLTSASTMNQPNNADPQQQQQQQPQECTGGMVAMNPDVQTINRAATESGGTAQTFLVTIPPHIHPGMTFTTSVEGQRFQVTCPPNASPGMTVRIVPPSQPSTEAAPVTQEFEVVVPPGVRPHQPFTLMANGQRVLVTCPPNVGPGQKIRFRLPIHQAAAGIKLSYNEGAAGWNRTIRVTDMKFQWVRNNKNDDKEGSTKALDTSDKFDFQKSAYVRKLVFMEGNDARMRTGTLELVNASQATCDSRLIVHNRTLISYADIASVQTKTFEEKTSWFQNLCTSQLQGDWEEGRIKLVVRRSHLLQDAMEGIMSLSRMDMRKKWGIEFCGEPGIDAGGVTREFFELVSDQILDPDFGLFHSSQTNQQCMTINPASKISCLEDYLIYYRFFGRILGKALFDRQLIKGHLEKYIYKHLLGWPITFEDLKEQDEDYYSSCKKLVGMDDVSLMCLDFTATEESLGAREEIELCEGGSLKEVTNDNLGHYLEANLRYRMLDRVKLPLCELLLGFFDVIPEPALTVFDSQELELLLCGLPSIDMEDWQSNTLYSGLFETKKSRHQVCHWFWDVVTNDFDSEMKARLLQFVTGTSGVPSRGFAVLQGNDANIKKFTVHGVSNKQYHYPRAHTCFNRIDLPDYKSKKQLEERLRQAIVMSAQGFDIE
mmetsp:Transcript_27729/g.42441  ORF Transcript_27729/g.42441 Transcript_27729/m.42441 type:complete len:755 (+) Transcript_27729:242-2506(+)